jgi:DNA-binding Xre family transcriptional regulator
MIEVRLKDLLKARERSRYWLSQETGIGYKTLMRIEQAESSNRIELRVLEQICRALECEPGDLLVLADDDTQANKGARRAGAKKSR